MKTCSCKTDQCKGDINRFKVFSPSNDTTYPNRFWGIVDYCEGHKNDDIEEGFILELANNETETYVL